MNENKIIICFQRPPSSSLSYGGAMNEDARSPGAGSTPGPLSQQAPVLDTSDPGENNFLPPIPYHNFISK